MNKPLTLYISMSIDGYLATEEDDLSFLTAVEQEGEDYGYFEFLERVDKYIVGKNTYEVVVKLCDGKFPASDTLDCYVVTSKELQDDQNGVHFYNGDLKSLVAKLKSEAKKGIYCDGGALLVKSLLEQNLIDEIIISIIPVFLGGGKRLFREGIPEQEWEALPAKTYETGLVQLHYIKKGQ